MKGWLQKFSALGLARGSPGAGRDQDTELENLATVIAGKSEEGVVGAVQVRTVPGRLPATGRDRPVPYRTRSTDSKLALRDHS
jgi:hypothetical protein